MYRHNYKLLSVIMGNLHQRLPISSLPKQPSFTRSRFRLVRALGVALIVVATLLSTIDAAALTRRKATKYGTLSYTVHNLEGKYKPGERYTVSATFAANDKVYGSQKSFMRVTAGGQTLGRQAVVVKKNKTTSATTTFVAPTDGSALTISFGNTGNDVFESITIKPIEEDVAAPETTTEDASTTANEESDNDTANTSNETSNDGETTDDGTDSSNADEENTAGENNSPDEDFLSSLTDNELIQAVQEWLAQDPFGLGQQATPEEAVGIGSVAALLAALLGGAGAIGGGVGGVLGGLGGLGGGAAGGSVPPPIEGSGGPSTPYQGVEDKYVTRDPDGSITVKDPITGEEKLYLPDGQGGYDNPLGGGFQSEADMLEHLAYLDRERELLSQDAATAAQNQAEQHAQWEAQNARDRERGYSDEMADYRDWKDNEEKKQEQITKLARKYGVEANEESVKRAIKLDQIKAGIEAAKQEAVAADQNVTVVGLESTKNVATTALALIPLALSGAGTVSVATMANAKIVQSCYTMATSVTGKVGDAYVKGEDMGKAAVHGTVTGAIDVAKNYAGDIAGKAVGAIGGASKAVKGLVNLGTEAAVVVGGEGVKKGYEEYVDSGDLNKALNKALDAVKAEGKKHIINKVAEVGIDKVRGLASGKTSVEGTRKHADATGKTVASRQQAVTRTQKQVTSAKESVAVTRKNVGHSQQQVTAARGKLNTANEQLSTAKGQLEAAQRKLGLSKSGDEVRQAQTELTRAQQGVAVAQQNVNRASSELQTAQRIDTATRRVAINAENNLQKAQFGAQKAQSDLKTATEQHQQALRDALAAEQKAQVDKTVAHMSGNDIVGGLRAVEEHLKNEGYLPRNDK